MQSLSLRSLTIVKRTQFFMRPLLMLVMLALSTGVWATTYTVTNTNNSGSGSLRQAISDANSNAGADVIDFNISGTAPFTISLSSALPAISDAVTIDGTTQTGYSGTPLIVINGSSAGGGASGLTVSASGCTIKALCVQGFALYGIYITGTANTVQGCFIGTNAAGTADSANTYGVYITDSSNIIGVAATNGGNLISGNQIGIYINGNRTTLKGNKIGTNAAGTGSVPNTNTGVWLLSNNNTVGGSATNERNVISGNTGEGIFIAGGTGNTIKGNYVGLATNGSSSLGNTVRGILIYSGAHTIGGSASGEGNVISANGYTGLEIHTGGSVIKGNYIGLDATGTSAKANGANGIYIKEINTTIGGSSSGDGNVISGNTSFGIVANTNARGLIIKGNIVGLNAAGTAKVSNGGDGIRIESGCNQVTIGGATTAERNIVSGNNGSYGVIVLSDSATVVNNYLGTDISGATGLGNKGDGILIDGDYATITNNVASGNTAIGIHLGSTANLNILTGNKTGTNAAGTAAIANGNSGIWDDGGNNTIGGSSASDGNLASGNTDYGIVVNSSASSGSTLKRNKAGTDNAGTAGIANGKSGIYLTRSQNTVDSNSVGFNTGSGILITTSDNTVRYNTIFSNTGNGVTITGSVTNNRLKENSIHSNSGLGIDLGNDGVTANDNGDTDTGPNNLQNFPVITSVAQSGGNTEIDGELSSAASSNYDILIYANTTADPSGYGEGQTYLGTKSVTTNGSGVGTFNLVVSGTYSNISAIAIDASGNTSEFGQVANVNQVAEITAGGSLTFCAGGSVVLRANAGASSYSWLKNGSSTSQTADSIVVADSGSYQVIVNFGSSTDTSDAVVVKVIPIPNTPTVTDGTGCVGDTVTLKAVSTTSGATTKWYKASTGGTQFTTGDSIRVKLNADSTFYAKSSFNGDTAILMNKTPAFYNNTGVMFDIKVLENTTISGLASLLYDPTTSYSDTAFVYYKEGSLTSATGPADWTLLYQQIRTLNAGTSMSDTQSLVFNSTISVQANKVYAFYIKTGTTGNGGPVTTSATSDSIVTSKFIARRATLATSKTSFIADTNYAYLFAPGAILISEPSCESSRVPVKATITQISATITSGSGNKLCQGDSILLSANTGTGYSYQWRKDSVDINGATDSIYYASDSGSFTLKVAIGSCFKESQALQLIVTPLPAAPTVTDGQGCAGDPITLKAVSTAAGTSTKWYTAASGGTTFASGDSISVTLNADSTFYAQSEPSSSLSTTYAGGNGQQGAMWNVIPKTEIYLQRIEFTTFQPSGSDTFNLYYTTGGFSSVQTNPSAWTLIGKGGYSGLGTSVKQSMTLFSPLKLDSGTTYGMYLTSKTGTLYVTYTSGSFPNSNSDLSITSGIGMSSGMFTSSTFSPRTWNGTIHYSAGASCNSARVPVVADVDAVTATITSNKGNAICQGDSALLSANTGTGYTYQWKKGSVDISGATDSIYYAADSGSYTVKVSNGSCFKESQALKLKINPFASTPTVTDGNGCVGDSIELKAVSTSAGSTTKWYKTASGGASFASGDSIYVTVNADSTFYAQSIFETGKDTLASNATTGNIFSERGVMYNIKVLNNISLEGIAPVLASLTTAISDSAFVYIKEGPYTTATGRSSWTRIYAGVVDYKHYSTNTKQSLIFDSPIALTANKTYSLYLQPASGNVNSTFALSSTVDSLVDSNLVAYKGKEPASYGGFTSGTGTNYIIYPADYFYSKGGNYCTNARVPVEAKVSAVTATITAMGDTTLCAGDSLLLTSSTGTGYSYQWQKDNVDINGATDSMIYASVSGMYTVTINKGFCTRQSQPKQVIVNPVPVATITPSAQQDIIPGDSVLLSANTGAGYSYKWLLDGVAIPLATNSAIQAKLQGNYQVVITASGCPDTSAATYVKWLKGEISLSYNGMDIADGSATAPYSDSTIIGKPITRTIKIKNTGLGPLNLSNLQLPSGFSLVGSFPSSVPAGDSANFSLKLDALANGTFVDTVSFTTDDDDENPFSFYVSGFVGCWNTIFVDGSAGDDNNIGSTSTAPKKTIQAGVDYTCDGGTLLIVPGTYNESVDSKDKTLTFQKNGTGAITLKDLDVNGTADVIYLKDPLFITGTLTLTNGILNTTANNTYVELACNTGSISGGNTSSYIEGEVRFCQAGSGTFTQNLPIGKGSFYRPISLTVNITTANPTDENKFSAEMFNTDPSTLGLRVPTGLRLIDERYYQVDRITASGTINGAQITLPFRSDADGEDISDLNNVYVLKGTGSVWTNLGGSASGNLSGLVYDGSITSNGFTSFSPFTLATGCGANPQPTVDFSFSNQCLGTGVTFTNNSAIASGDIVRYTWDYGDGSAQVTQNGTYPPNPSALTYTYASAGTYAVSLQAESDMGCIVTFTKYVTIVPTPSATITAATATACNGDNFDFTVNVSNVGATDYWSLAYTTTNPANNVTVNGTGPGNFQFSSPALTGPTSIIDLVTLTNTSSNPNCANSTLGQMAVTVSPNTVGGSVTANATVCNGTNSGTLTLAGHTGNVVRWEYSTDAGNSWVQITNSSTSQGYSNLTTTTMYRAVVQSGVCPEVNSSAATITVNPLPVASINAGTTICAGNTATLSVTVANTGGASWSISYQEAGANNTLTGTGNGVFNLVTGTLTATTDVLLKSITLTSGSPLCTSTLNSKATVTVNPLPNVTISGATTICTGSTADLTATVSNVKTTDNWSIAYTDGTTNYTRTGTGPGNFTITTPALTSTTTFTVSSITNTTTTCVRTITGQAATVTVSPASVGGSVTANATVCSGSNSGTLTLAGNTGTVQKWQYSTDAGTTWFDVANTGSTYNYSNITTSTMYRAVVKSGACATASSAAATITVNPLPVASIAAGGSACAGSAASLTVFVSNTNGSAWSIDYQEGGTNKTLTGTGNGSFLLTTGTLSVNTDVLLKAITLTSGSPLCTNTLNSKATVTVHPMPSATISGSQSICTGNAPAVNVSISSVATGQGWSLSYKEGATTKVLTGTGSGSFALNTSVLTNPATSSVTYTLTSITNTSTTPNCTNSSLSGSHVVSISSATAGGSLSPAATTHCGYTNGGTITLSGHNGAIMRWEYSTDGGTTWVNISNSTSTYTYANLNTTTRYRALLQNSPCGTAYSSVSVITVNPQAMAVISGSQTICSGSTPVIDVTVSNVPAGHNWSLSYTEGATNKTLTGSGSGSFVLNASALSNPPATVTYTLTSITNTTVSPACVNSSLGSKHVVTIDPTTVGGFTSASPSAVCFGSNSGSITLTGNTGSIVRWEYSTDGGTSWVNISNNTASQSYSNLTQTTRYRALVKSGMCAQQYSSESVVTVNPLPVAAISGSTEICTGGNTQITFTVSNVASGNTWTINYTENGSAKTFTGVGNGSFSMPTGSLNYPPDKVEYKLVSIVNTTTTCSNTATGSAIVTVNPRPQPAFSMKNACAGSNVSFSNKSKIAKGTISGYTWYFGDGATSSSVNPSHVYATAGTYSVKLVTESLAGCKDSITRPITIHPNPVASFTASNACLNDSVIFNNTSTLATGAITTYKWTFGDGDTSNSMSPKHKYKATGTYTVSLTIVSDSGCTSSATRTVTLHPLPVAGFTAVPVCEDDSMQFINSSSVSYGKLTYAWDFGNGATSTQKEPKFRFNGNGSFNVRLIVTSENGCKDSISRIITIHPKPLADFDAPAVCIGEESYFTNTTTIASGNLTDMEWDLGDSTTSFGKVVRHTYSRPGTYTVRLIVRSDKGCSDTTTKSVTVNPLPDATITAAGPVAFCLGGNVDLSAPAGMTAYLWSTGATTATINVDRSGVYKVRVINANGCANEDSIRVTVWELPKAYAGRDTTISKGYTVQLQGKGGIAYTWTPADGLDNANIANPRATPLITTTYIMTVTDTNGCTNSDTITITVLDDIRLEVTNTITPNGDGKNDVWYIGNIMTYPDCEIMIFNRYGQEVYRTKGYNNDWGGTYNGKDLPDGTYYYVIDCGSDKVYKGSINIIRSR